MSHLKGKTAVIKIANQAHHVSSLHPGRSSHKEREKQKAFTVTWGSHENLDNLGFSATEKLPLRNWVGKPTTPSSCDSHRLLVQKASGYASITQMLILILAVNVTGAVSITIAVTVPMAATAAKVVFVTKAVTVIMTVTVA